MSTSTSSTSPYSSVNPIFLVSSALALVAGLAWNEAIQTGIEEFGPQDTGTQFKAKIIYAIIITVIVIIIIYIMEYAKGKFGISI
jgi:Family of unknown function (DUF5654)